MRKIRGWGTAGSVGAALDGRVSSGVDITGTGVGLGCDGAEAVERNCSMDAQPVLSINPT